MFFNGKALSFVLLCVHVLTCSGSLSHGRHKFVFLINFLHYVGAQNVEMSLQLLQRLKTFMS